MNLKNIGKYNSKEIKELHFSIDDVFNSLVEISEKKIPLKKHYFFKELYKIWKKYKIKTGLNVFFENTINNKSKSLKNVRKMSKELSENWIYFNFHALKPSLPPYKQKTDDQKKTFEKITNEIKRFAGKKYLSKYVRLHHYSESFELSNFFKKYKIKGVFTTDRKIGSHRMPKKNSNELLHQGKTIYNNIHFYRTDLRIEWLANSKNDKILKHRIRKVLNKKNRIIIYSHEYEFKRKKILKTLNKTMKFLFSEFKVKSISP